MRILAPPPGLAVHQVPSGAQEFLFLTRSEVQTHAAGFGGLLSQWSRLINLHLKRSKCKFIQVGQERRGPGFGYKAEVGNIRPLPGNRTDAAEDTGTGREVGSWGVGKGHDDTRATAMTCPWVP